MASLVITEKGRNHVNAIGRGGTVLRYLNSNGPSTADEIADRLGPNSKPILRKLFQRGYIVKDGD